MNKGPENGITTATDLATAAFHDPEFTRVNPKWSLISDAVDILEQTVFGQTRAMTSVAKAAIRVRAGMVTPGRPEFVGIFSGLHGVGKTETAQGVARLYWGDNWQDHFKIIPCAIFQDRHTIGRLTGSIPGYWGWGDPNSFMIHPDFTQQRNVIVFDEVEKGHEQLFRVLLNILEGAKLPIQIGKEGTYDESTGRYKVIENRDVDFSKSTIIFTTNIGGTEILKGFRHKGKPVGYNKQAEPVNVHNLGMDALTNYFGAFMPEFLNRIPIQNRIIFNALSPDVLKRIFVKTLDKINPQTTGAQILATPQLMDWIIGKLDLEEGARQLQALIEDYIITQAAMIRLERGANVPLIAGVDLKDGEGAVTFKTHKSFINHPERLEALKETLSSPAPVFPDQGISSDNDRSDSEPRIDMTESGIYLASS